MEEKLVVTGREGLSLPSAKSGLPAREVAETAAREAGRIIMAHFHQQKRVVVKGRGNLVTDVDNLVEERLREILRREYPECGIVGEEGQDSLGSSEYTWIVDPLDGTRNYVSGIPFFGVTVALVRGGVVVLGVVYDPVRDEFFLAEGGGGARCNGHPLAVAQKGRVREAVIGMDMGYDDDRGRENLEIVSALWPGVQTLRIMGSAALGITYVAAGRLDLYFHSNLYPWDLASGILLVGEAGGTITQRDGAPIDLSSRSVLAANSPLHGDFLRLTRH